jgi:hypothetical protein
MTTNTTSHTLYLDLDDEITSVIDRLVAADSEQVTLVIPKSAVVLQSAVNLKLLKNAAQRLKKTLLVVTRDETGLTLALRAGINVRTTLAGKTITPGEVLQSAPAMATIREEEALPSDDSVIDRARVEPPEPEPAEAEENAQVQMRPSLRAIVEQERRQRTLTRAEKEHVQRIQAPMAPAQAITPARTARTLPPTRKAPRIAHATPGSTAMGRRLRDSDDSVSSDSLVTRMTARVRLLPNWPWRIIGPAIGGVAIFGFLLFTFAFAKAQIVVTPKTETVSVDLEVSARENPDAAKKEITGTLVQLSREGKKSITPTGKKEAGSKAGGAVTISNVFSDKPQSFGVNTRLQAGSGQVFLLTAQVSVPGATVNKGKPVPGSVSASVTAEKFGEEYNIGPTSFTFIDLAPDQQAGITAASDAPMTGGLKKEVTVLQASDVDAAKKAVAGELGPVLTTELRAQLAPTEELLEGASSVETTNVKSSVAVGSEAEQVDVTLTVVTKAIVNRPDEIRTLALDELRKSLPANKQLQDQQQETVTWQFKSVDMKQETLVIAVHAEKPAVYTFDENALLAQLIGKTRGEAQTVLGQLPEVASVKVRLSPVWRRKLPKNPQKIEFSVNQ